MFNKPVVFVIGAGASNEYNFPLGGDLKNNIAEKVNFRFEQIGRLLKGDYELLAHIERHVPGDRSRRNDYTRAASVLAKAIGSFISIDEALHYVAGSPEAVEVGKIAIIQEILRAERESSLAPSREIGRLDIDKVSHGWISEMFSMAIANTQRENLDTAFDKITFVNFNYDRAIEQYLFWALQQRASASADQAMQIVRNLNFIRPYGSIGPLDQASGGIAFGSSEHIDPFSLIDRIRTYTEKQALHDANLMSETLSKAHLIIFLGFGYHAPNLDLLKTNEKSRGSVLGTVVKIHRENLSVITRRIANNLVFPTDNVTLLDMGASALLRDLRQRILISLE